MTLGAARQKPRFRLPDRSSCCHCGAHLHTGVALAAQLPHQELVELGVKHAIGHGLQASGRQGAAKSADLAATAAAAFGVRRVGHAPCRWSRPYAVLWWPAPSAQRAALLAVLASMRARGRMRPTSCCQCLLVADSMLCARDSASSSAPDHREGHSGPAHLAGLADARHLHRGSPREVEAVAAPGFMPACCVL